MSRCPDRAVKCRWQKTSWTSTGTSRGAARVTEPRVEPLTTGREVKMKLRVGTFQSSERWTSSCFFGADICGEDGVHDSSRDDALQNISADDLLDSASQTARQHDSKFSLRSLSCSQHTSSHSLRLSQYSLGLFAQTLASLFFVSCLPSSDAKKKLRLALCSADSVALPIMAPATTRNGLPDHMDSEGTPSRRCREKNCDVLYCSNNQS